MKIYLTLFFYGIILNSYAQLPANINEAQEIEDFILFNELLAKEYAPLFKQQVSREFSPAIADILGIRDLIVGFDFDDDWIMDNNWENCHDIINSFPAPNEIINLPSLKPKIYYMVTWLECEWIITYAYFHPIDWSKCDWPIIGSGYDWYDEHENDVEAAVLYVSRETKEIIELKTIFHNTTLSTTTPSFDSLNHPIIKIKNETHSGIPWDVSDDPEGTGCVQEFDFYIDYKVAENESEVLLDYENKMGKYELVNIFGKDELYSRKTDNRVMNQAERLIGDNGIGKNKASVPWAFPAINLCEPSPSANCFNDKVIFNQCSSAVINNTKILVYPNPAKGQLIIDLLGAAEKLEYVSIFDNLGKLLSEHKLFSNQETINISHLPSGIYFLKFNNADNNFVKKIIIEN